MALMLPFLRSILALTVLACAVKSAEADEYSATVKPLLSRYCCDCHSGDAPNGDVDFAAIRTPADVVQHFDRLERGIKHLESRRMPPPEEPQPTNAERDAIGKWYRGYVSSIEIRPADFRPRRLSVQEYRNTLRSVFGFELEVAIIEAEQTLAERSLVIKVMPTDPPGESGFTNDTHRNRLTTVAWDQYAYLADAAIEKLFARDQPAALQRFTGPIRDQRLTEDQAAMLIREFLIRTQRRPPTEQSIAKSLQHIAGRTGARLTEATRFELKAMLMSPSFLFRGLLSQSADTGRQPVDTWELAERLSYFLWADMPDEQLRSRAADRSLRNSRTLAAEIDRMLASPKARSLSDVFATEWLTLKEIEQVSDNPPVMLALKSQPLDFTHYLFTQNRPLLELIDSDTAFINPHTARHYGRDAQQLVRAKRQKGIEVAAIDNQRIRLESTTTRGGVLTMPGVLAMNQGPIQRGTWVLERILGEELPDPPPDVGQVPPNRGDSELTFRQRFEQHRSNETCAVCHDKIDPLGFALQAYDTRGTFIKAKNDKPGKRDVRKGLVPAKPETGIDTHGRLPTGEEFDDISGLKDILQTSQRRAVIRNIVRRTLSYALCRRLMIYDRPTVESITEKMDRENGTWRDLFLAIAVSVPFQETIRK